MAFNFVFLFACLLGSSVTGLPVGDGDLETPYPYLYSDHFISGASGSFSYPLSGSSYENYELVTIRAEFPANTLFIIEDYDIEWSSTCTYDKLSLHYWRRNVADISFCGRSTEHKYFRADKTFLLTFATDGTYAKSGFNLRWGPIEPLAN